MNSQIDDVRVFIAGIYLFTRKFSVHVTIGGLGQLLISDHFVLEADEHLLQGVAAVPVGEEREALCDGAGALVHGRNVALRVELDSGRTRGVVLAAADRQHVDAVVEVGVGRADDGAVPVRESLVTRCIQMNTRSGHQIFRINHLLGAAEDLHGVC